MVISGGQLAGAIALVVLSAINYYGLREGAGVQNVVTVFKIGSIAALAVAGLLATTPAARPELLAPAPSGSLLWLSAWHDRGAVEFRRLVRGDLPRRGDATPGARLAPRPALRVPDRHWL